MTIIWLSYSVNMLGIYVSFDYASKRRVLYRNNNLYFWIENLYDPAYTWMRSPNYEFIAWLSWYICITPYSTCSLNQMYFMVNSATQNRFDASSSYLFIYSVGPFLCLSAPSLPICVCKYFKSVASMLYSQQAGNSTNMKGPTFHYAATSTTQLLSHCCHGLTQQPSQSFVHMQIDR